MKSQQIFNTPCTYLDLTCVWLCYILPHSIHKLRVCFLAHFCLTSIVSSTHVFPVFESCSASVNCCYVGFYETLSWLCYSVLGKILNDDQPLSEYKIDEKGFVVVMVTKVKNFFCCSGISPLGHLFWKDTSIHGTQNLVWRDAHIISVSVTSVEVQGKEPLFLGAKTWT